MTEASGDFASGSLRLNYLEQKVKALKPGEAVADQRIYKLTLGGSLPGVENADWSKNTTLFETMPDGSVTRSLFTSIFGQQLSAGPFYARVSTIPFYNQVWGPGPYSTYVDENTSMASAILPSNGKTYVANLRGKLYSLWEGCFGSESAFDAWYEAPSGGAGKSLGSRQVDAEALIVDLQATCADLQRQINNLR